MGRAESRDVLGDYGITMMTLNVRKGSQFI